MSQNLNRITLLTLLAFGMVAVSLVYWSVFASDSMLARNDNPRLVEAERALIRGGLYDRDGLALAQTLNDGTSPSGKPVVRRDYTVPEAVSVVGYYSLVHGVGGAEAAFDPQLRGDDTRTSAQVAIGALLHTPQVGSDIRLTLSAALQKNVLAALKDKQAAAVAIEVPSGAVLAMVSTPNFDPNKLDINFAALQRDPAAPLLNRATQGLYQPGGALETVILAALLSDRVDITQPVAGSTSPVVVSGLTLNCPQQAIGLSSVEAYLLACPGAFADAAEHHPASVQKMLEAFGLLHAPTLPNFEMASGKPILPLNESEEPLLLMAEGVGQGTLTVTPFQMALVVATIANHGNAVTPRLGDAIRAPGSSDWKTLPTTQGQMPVVTQDIADAIGGAMQSAVKSGTAQAAARPNLTIRGHASIAHIGPDQKQAAWFIGYINLPDGRSVAIAVVINDTDVSTVADIGGTTLAEAARLLK